MQQSKEIMSITIFGCRNRSIEANSMFYSGKERRESDNSPGAKIIKKDSDDAI